MGKIVFVVFLMMISASLCAQQKTIITYYRNIKLDKEVHEKNARFKMVSQFDGSDKVDELFELKSGKLIRHKSFRDHVPFGEWYVVDEEGLKANEVVYGKLVPPDCYTFDLKKQQLTDKVDGDFLPPKIIGVSENVASYTKAHKVSEIAVWIAFNVRYPIEAQIKQLQGKVQTQFAITEEGEITDVRIARGVDEVLDAEAYRLLRSFPKMSPATLNGKKIKVYIETPINFVFQ